MNQTILNITHNQSWIINKRDIFTKENIFSSFGSSNASPNECQIYLICKRNKISFRPFALPIPINDREIIHVDLVEHLPRNKNNIHRSRINLSETIKKYYTNVDCPRCYSNEPHHSLILEFSPNKQLEVSVQGLLNFLTIPTPQIFDLEICYIGQSFNKKHQNIFANRLIGHEVIQEIDAEIEKNEPNKEILITLLNITQNPPATLLLGGASNNYKFSRNDIQNMDTSKIPYEDLINSAEAILINSFKPTMNTKFVNNLLQKKLKTIQYFRQKGYGGISFELNFQKQKQNFFSDHQGRNNFFLFDYDLTSNKNGAKFIKICP